MRPARNKAKAGSGPAISRLILAYEKNGRQTRSNRSGVSARVHAVRVQAKRLNALLHLARPFILKPAFKRSREEIRAARRMLGKVRDREVIRCVLEKTADKLPDAERREQQRWIRTRLHPSRNVPSRDRIDSAAARLDRALARLPRPEGPGDLRTLALPGLRRAYSQARSRYKKACSEGNAKSFHDWRKCAKLLHLQLALLTDAGLAVDPEARTALDKPQSRLGDHHDLVLARDFAPGGNALLKPLKRKIRRDLRSLEKKLRRRGKKLFTDKSAAFLKNILGAEPRK